MHQFISGTFDDAATANKVVDEIMAMDYPLDRITIIMSTQTRNRSWTRPAVPSTLVPSKVTARYGPVGRIGCSQARCKTWLRVRLRSSGDRSLTAEDSSPRP